MGKPVIVLGAAHYDGRLSASLRARVRQALKFGSTSIITVGGTPPGERLSEAQVARDYLVDHGVSVDLVVAVERGDDTISSLAAILERCALREAYIVTDAVHGPRTWLIARGLGLRATIVAAKESPTRFPRPTWWRSLAHEIGGVIDLGAQRYLPAPFARVLKRGLYRIEALLRPSWYARHHRKQ